MSYFEADDDYPAIVLDNGSSTCRAGFAGEDAPRSVFPSIVGRRRHQLLGNREFYIGDEAQDKRELLSLTYPIEHGIVVNWDDMEKIWNHAFFSELSILPEEHPILLSEPPLNPKSNREKITQVMFETYRVPAFCIAFEAVLSLYSMGRLTGTMVNVGDGVTHVVPILNGYAVHQAIQRSDFAGRDLTNHLQHLLYQRGFNFTTTADLDIVREIKEQKCFVSANRLRPNDSLAVSASENSYKLPDGTSIKLGQEQYQCPESLFNPDKDSQNSVGLGELIFNSINTCEIDCRRDLCSYVALSGGSTFFPGFKDRLQKDLETSTTTALTGVRVAAAPERKYHLWIGASLLASLTSFQCMWVTQKEYNEYGPNILYLKSY